MDRRKLVFIIPNAYNNGGICRVTISLINALNKTKTYDITLLSLQDGSVPFYTIDDDIKIVNLPIKHFIIRKHTILAARNLKKMFLPDFNGTFIIDDVGYNIPAWLGLNHCKNAKFVSWSHMNFFNGSKYGFSGIGKRLAVNRFDHLVALTKEDKGYYDRILKADNVVQIYNPKDASVIKGEYRKESKKIISCGRLHPIKGFDFLIEVADMVFQKVDSWTWDIYGDGPELKNLQKKISDYGLVGKVNLMGYHTEIFSLYNYYALYVFTSHSEGCPMTMIEAMAAGLPMISFDFKCGPKDLITNGKNGYVISDWNTEAMAESIISLIENQELRSMFAKNSDMNLQNLELSYVLDQWKKIL